MEGVKQFVANFKDQLLIPLAKEGYLDQDMIYDVMNTYAEELSNSHADKFEITATNDYKVLHPSYNSDFKHLDKVWISLEHFIQAAKYFGANDELAESIRLAPTSELATRRGLNAAAAGGPFRQDWEKQREQEIAEAVRAMLKQNEVVRNRLMSTAGSSMTLPHETDDFLGLLPNGNGKNVYGRILFQLRDDLRKSV